MKSVQPYPMRREMPPMRGGNLELVGRSIRVSVEGTKDGPPGEVVLLRITSLGWELSIRGPLPNRWDTKPVSLAEALDTLPEWRETIVALHLEMEKDLDAGIDRAVRRMLDLERERERTVKPRLLAAAKKTLEE